MKTRMYVAIALSAVLIGTGSTQAQMMGGGQDMMQEAPQQQERVPQSRNDESYMQGGYGMGPGMMGGYGMGPGMMGKYGWGQGAQQFSSPEQYEKFLDETKDLRKKMHDLRFEYGEMMRNPETTMGDLKRMQQEMYELQKKIQEKAPQ